MQIYEENSQTFGDRYAVYYHQHAIEAEYEPPMLEDSIINESVYKAFSELTTKQKMILTFTYSMCFLDREIADRLSITPQAVSKARAAALTKLKKRLIGFNRYTHREEAN
jgi:DNA-directed RNA polymerase specialized sigma subunit